MKLSIVCLKKYVLMKLKASKSSIGKSEYNVK